MQNRSSLRLVLILLLGTILTRVSAETDKADDPFWTSTRIVDRFRFDSPTKGHPYRKRSDWILRELDLRDGDVVVDVGAGDGWWAGKLARHVGKDGIVHASEITDKLVDEMKRQFAGTPQVKPYRSPLDEVRTAQPRIAIRPFEKRPEAELQSCKDVAHTEDHRPHD